MPRQARSAKLAAKGPSPGFAALHMRVQCGAFVNPLETTSANWMVLLSKGNELLVVFGRLRDSGVDGQFHCVIRNATWLFESFTRRIDNVESWFHHQTLAS